MIEKDVLYLCDKRECEKCSSVQCKHTLDITHAKNFELGIDGSTYVEKAPVPLVIFKTDSLLRKETCDRIRDVLKKQIEEGLVLCDGAITDIVVYPDGDDLQVQVKIQEVKNG
jgi:hypothetical protein